MRFWIVLLLGSMIVFCSPEHRRGTAPGITSAESEPAQDVIDAAEGQLRFSMVVEDVLQPAGCFDCHGKYKNIDNIRKAVVPGAPEQSRLYIRASTDMPPIEDGYPPLSEEQLSLLREWILQGAIN